MSLTKRIWIELDPAYEDVRQRYAEEAWRYIKEFEFRIPLRRRNRWEDSPYWAPLWPRALRRAAEELGFEVVKVNDGMFFRTREQRDATVTLAEDLWHQDIARRRQQE